MKKERERKSRVRGEETRSLMTAAQHEVEEDMNELLEAKDRSRYEAMRRRNNMYGSSSTLPLSCWCLQQALVQHPCSSCPGCEDPPAL